MNLKTCGKVFSSTSNTPQSAFGDVIIEETIPFNKLAPLALVTTPLHRRCLIIKVVVVLPFVPATKMTFFGAIFDKMLGFSIRATSPGQVPPEPKFKNLLTTEIIFARSLITLI